MEDALPDPSARLTAAFRAAAARMQGLDVVNPALAVEAVGFAPWNEHWLGVMLTPWFMNLTLLPRNPGGWRPLATGAKRRYAFPAGEYEFVGANDAMLGAYQVCSLFSPVHEFADQETARLVATLAREALFDAANAGRRRDVHRQSVPSGGHRRTGPARATRARARRPAVEAQLPARALSPRRP